MPDFYQKITDMHGTLEDLARKVPGFQGYFEKRDRRAADRLLREKLAGLLEERSTEFTRLQRRLVDSGGIMYMERVQGIDLRLRTLIDRVESASQGYAGLFDAVKIDEAALTRVYAFDNTLFVYCDQLATGLKQLGEAIGTDGVDGVLTQLDDLVAEAHKTFDRRADAMRGLEDSV